MAERWHASVLVLGAVTTKADPGTNLLGLDAEGYAIFMNPEHARLAVQAVNSHDALVDALEEIRDYRGGAESALDDPYVIERIDAALALAKREAQ